MRRILLPALGLLSLCPLLAHADALDGAFFILQLLAVVWGIALLGMILSALEYRRPTSRALKNGSLLVNGLGLLIGLVWMLVFSQSNSFNSSGIGEVNPFLTLSIPFAAWLGAATRATTTLDERTRRWYVAVALAGATMSLNMLLNYLLRWLLPEVLIFNGGFGSRWLLGLVLQFGAWWLVLTQVQRLHPLAWRPSEILLVPLWVLLLSTAYGYLPILPLLLQAKIDLVWLLPIARYGCVSWGVGVLVLWLRQRRPHMAA